MAEELSDADTRSSLAVLGNTSQLFELLLLLSGFCGISYEILYGRVLSNFIGDQFAVSASILLTFLLGIGLGTLYAHRFWRFLWLIEGAIGAGGILIAVGFPYLDQWLYISAQSSSSLSAAIVTCFLVLTIPAFLVGCSLPLFAGYLSQLNGGRIFARAYSLYNFGAAATALLIEFWLLRMLGVRNTVLTIATINAVVSFGLFIGFRQLRNAAPMALSNVTFPFTQLTGLATASIASAIFQLLMIKLAECILGPFRETFALILALILAGIALGSLLTERLHLNFSRLMLMGLISLGWLVGGFSLVAHAYAALHPLVVDNHVTIVLLKLGTLAVLMGPPAVAFGGTIPAMLGEQKNVARESGQLLCVSSVANAFGFLLMAFVLHRYFDYGILIVIISGLTAIAAIIYGGFEKVVLSTAVSLLVVILALQHWVWDENLLYLGHTSFNSSADLKEAKEDMRFPEKFKGYQDVFSLTQTRGSVQFFINGFISISLNAPAEKIVGAFPALFAPRTDRALVLGLGSGTTGGTVALLFDRVDAVEINPVVVENLFRMAEYNFNIQSRRNVNIVVDDGIHFSKVSQEKYSLIVNTVTTPLYFSSSKLYTLDFFEAIRRILTPDGLYVTWIDSRVGDRGVDIILKTLGRSFQHCWIGAIKSTYFLLMCSQQQIALRQPHLVENNSTLTNYLFAKNGLRAEWLPYGLLGTRALTLISDSEVPLNTLDYPALEFEIARLGKRGIDAFKRRLWNTMDLDDVATAISPVKFNPLHLAMHANLLLGDSTITDRWMNLVSREVNGFPALFTQTKLEYLAAHAAAAKTGAAYRKYGAALLAENRYDDSIQQFRTALSIDPKTDNAYFNIGAAYEKSGRLDAALDNYGNELKVDPTDDEVAYRQGRVLYKLKRYDEALAHLEASVKQNDTSNTEYYLGLTLEAVGRPTEAKRAYTRALALNSNHQDARLALTKMQEGVRQIGGQP